MEAQNFLFHWSLRQSTNYTGPHLVAFPPNDGEKLCSLEYLALIVLSETAVDFFVLQLSISLLYVYFIRCARSVEFEWVLWVFCSCKEPQVLEAIVTSVRPSPLTLFLSLCSAPFQRAQAAVFFHSLLHPSTRPMFSVLGNPLPFEDLFGFRSGERTKV
jgi:hypothetical protein